jgi:malonyl-CoA/methylmalonyl-CoA synthetase
MNDKNLYSLFESRFPADRRPPSYSTTERVSTPMRTRAAPAASTWQARASPGDRVAVQVEAPQALLVSRLPRAGLVYLPLNTATRRASSNTFATRAAPIAQPSSLPWLEPLARRFHPHVFSLDEEGRGSWSDAAASRPPSFTTVERGTGDLAAILYTSRTTGRSEGAMITHGNLAANALALHRAWGFRPDDMLVHMLPLFHVHGLFVAPTACC